MHESRCGIRCSACERREKVKCTGCLNMEMPFWGGRCEVKSCCESKKLDHCGLCETFPCDMLSNMGKDQGYDPEPRLNACREWAEPLLTLAGAHTHHVVSHGRSIISYL